MKCKIRLKGCDADTEFEMDINSIEWGLLRRVADKSKETSEYDCMPIMEVALANES